MISACLIRKILVLWISSWTLTWQVPAKNRYYRFREFCEVPTNTNRYRYWEITNILYRFCREFVILVLKSTKNNECRNIGISICNAISDWNGIMRLFCWFCTNFSPWSKTSEIEKTCYFLDGVPYKYQKTQNYPTSTPKAQNYVRWYIKNTGFEWEIQYSPALHPSLFIWKIFSPQRPWLVNSLAKPPLVIAFSCWYHKFTKQI